MGRETGIAWTDHTFNPWRGCTKVSPACANCYAEMMSKRNPAVLGEWGPNGKRVMATAKYWAQAFAWDRAAERDGVRRKVFCASLADVFEDRPELEAQRDRLHATIALTPNLDWLLLTKRPGEARRYYSEHGMYGRVLRAAEEFRQAMPRLGRIGISDPASPQGRANRWLGTSVEDQPTADARVPVILDVAAAVHFVSYEPALGPWYPESTSGGRRPEFNCLYDDPRVDWIIVGGESGPKARPFDIAWARSAVAQCRAAGVACFVKQLGANPVGEPWAKNRRFSPLMSSRSGADPAEWPEDLRVREFPR